MSKKIARAKEEAHQGRFWYYPKFANVSGLLLHSSIWDLRWGDEIISNQLDSFPKAGRFLFMGEHFQEGDEQRMSEIQSEVDLSLIDINLRLSIEERIQKHDEAARLVEDLLKAGEAWRRGQSQ